MNNGYIKLARKYFENFLWEEKREFSKAEAWLDLIQTARYKEGSTTKIIDGKLVTYSRGELIGSYRFLAKRWGWKSLSKVRNFLQLLEKNSQIQTAKEQQLTKITLCNYELYNPLRNSDELENEQQANSKRTAKKQRRNKTVIKEEGSKNDKKEIKYFLNLIPSELNNEKFITSWKEWIDYKTKKKKPLLEPTAIKQLNFLNKQPNPIGCINISIQNGWEGLFEMKGGNNGNNNVSAKYDYQKPREGQEFKVIGSD